MIAVQVREKHSGDRFEIDAVSFEIGYQLARCRVTQHVAMRTESSVSNDSLIARSEHERSQIVLEKLTLEVLRESIVVRLPYLKGLLRKQCPRVERNASIT